MNAKRRHTDKIHTHREKGFEIKYINPTENMCNDILPFIICSATRSKQKKYTTGETDCDFTGTAAESWKETKAVSFHCSEAQSLMRCHRILQVALSRLYFGIIKSKTKWHYITHPCPTNHFWQAKIDEWNTSAQINLLLPFLHLVTCNYWFPIKPHLHLACYIFVT